MEWVAVDAAEPDAGILEEAHPVGRGDDRLPAAADGDGLAPAGVAGVLVGLDDARRDDQVGVLHDPLRGAWNAVGRDDAQVGPHPRVAAVRVRDPHPCGHGRAELLDLLGVGRGAVEADGDQDRDVRVGDAPGIQLVQERLHQDVVRTRAGQVGDRDDRARQARSRGAHRLGGEVTEAFGSERRAEARPRCRREIADRSSRDRFDHVDVEPGLHHELQLVVAVRDAKHLLARRPLHRLTLGETVRAAGA